ncbi:hypothetical protein [Acidovorax sp.]
MIVGSTNEEKLQKNGIAPMGCATLVVVNNDQIVLVWAGNGLSYRLALG